jgi:cell division protein FtsB
MNSDDQLARLLRSADAAANRPALPSDLPSRIRLRQQERRESVRRIRAGLVTSAVVIVAAISLRSLYQRDALRPVAPRLQSADIAALRAESEQFAAEAADLERRLSLIRNQETLTKLRQQHNSHALAGAGDPLSPLDRAALVGISQGDFYRDIRQSLDDAKAAYEGVLADFPDTRWASVAQSRIDLLMMN